MSNWKLKRAHHRAARPDHTITIVGASKPNPTKRKKPDGNP
jgi:hypothetical protein